MSITVRPTVVTVRGGRQAIVQVDRSVKARIEGGRTPVTVQGGQQTTVQVDRTTAVQVAAGVGPRGPAGPSGADQDSFNFVQATPAMQWSISHNLGRRPIVELLSAGGMEIDADVVHLSADQVLVNFVIPTAGSARLI